MTSNKQTSNKQTSNKQTSNSKTPVGHGRTVTLTLEEWEAWRRAAGLHIDPETAEVLWDYRQVVDPYRIWPEIPEECDCVGRSYFARSPGMDVWVEFGDLPDATRAALWEKYKSQLAFPAGLNFLPFVEHYLEENSSPISSLSEVELGQAPKAVNEAFLPEQTRLQVEASGDYDDGAKS
jgi:hypothetical protein